MLEDILTDLASLGYVVSNTFQLGAGDPRRSPFGTPGWQVYLRNERNTRAGQGQGTTLGEAFLAALATCEAQPTAAQRPTSEWAASPMPIWPNSTRTILIVSRS